VVDVRRALVAITSALAVAAMSTYSVAAASGLVVDGDFETPSHPSGTIEYTGGQTFGGSGAAWTVTGNSIDEVHGLWQDAEQSGTQSVDLNGADAGGIYQDLATTANTAYTLSFFLAGNFNCGPEPKTMTVSWGGSVIDTESFDASNSDANDMHWRSVKLSISATAATTRLAFDSTVSSACGAVVDDVSVTAVPVPTPSPTAAPTPAAPRTGGAGLPLVAIALLIGATAVVSASSVLSLRRRR
jgi:choice-of-anchor C domain-containing protein